MTTKQGFSPGRTAARSSRSPWSTTCHDCQIRHLPTNILVGEILPFLDRTSSLTFLGVCKDIYVESQKVYHPPWPVGDFYHGLQCSQVSCMAFSPDMSTLALGCSDGWIRLWNPRFCRRGTLKGCTANVLSVAFSPHGRLLLAAASQDCTIRIFAAERDYQLERTLHGKDGTRFQWVTFSPDSTLLASSSWDEAIRLYRVSDGVCVFMMPGQRYGVNSVGFSVDCRILATVREDRRLLFWDLRNGTEGTLYQSQQFNHDDLNVCIVAFSPDGNHFATSGNAGADHCIRLWRIADGKCVQLFRGHLHLVECIVFSADGKRMASATCDLRDSVKVWDVDEGSCLKTLAGNTSGSISLAFSADGRTLVANFNHVCSIWRI